jgi:MFS family permease
MHMTHSRQGDTPAHESGAEPATNALTAQAGGRYPWIVAAGAFAAFTISVVDRMTWGNVSTFYAHGLGMPVAALGSFFSAFYVGYLIANALSGFAADRFGGRRMLLLVLILLGVFTFSFSLTRSIVAGFVIQCAMGLVSGMDYSACMRLLSDVFPPEKRATAMGLFLPSLAIGVTLPNLFVPTLLHTYGWEGVYRTLGVLTVAIGIAIYFVLGKRAELYGRATRSLDRSFKQLLGNRGFRLTALAGFGQQWGMWGFAFWSNALLIKGHHIDPVRAGFIIAVFGVVGLVMKPLAGWIVDHVGISKPVIGAAGCLIFCTSLLVFAVVSVPGTFAFVTAVIGIASAFAGVVVATLTVQTAGTRFAGTASGLANCLWSLGNVLVPLVVGAVFQYSNSFGAAILALAVGPAFGAVCFMRIAILGIADKSEFVAMKLAADGSQG